jgi:hypothetical protein
VRRPPADASRRVTSVPAAPPTPEDSVAIFSGDGIFMVSTDIPPLAGLLEGCIRAVKTIGRRDDGVWPDPILPTSLKY